MKRVCDSVLAQTYYYESIYYKFLSLMKVILRLLEIN